MRIRTLAVVAALVVAACRTEADPTLEYRIRFVGDAPTPALEVELTFQSGPEDRTGLRLPSRWAGQEELYRSLGDLHAVGPETTVRRTTDPALLIVHHPPSSRVTIRYRVTQDWEGEVRREFYHRAVVQPEYFHIVGHALLVHPEWKWERPVHLEVFWEGAEGTGFASSLGVGSEQSMHGKLEDAVRTVFVGGDYRLSEVRIRDQAVHVAARGEWRFGDDEFLELLSTIVRTERDFWDDHEFPYYLVTLTPASSGIGGSGLTNSFFTFANPERELDEGFPYLLTHELFHTWNGGRIRADSAPARQYWFTEGLTDYYTYRLLRESGLFSFIDYVDQLNETMREYRFLSASTAPRSAVEEGYWSDRDLGRLPYLRGHLIGLWMNHRISEYTDSDRSLDDVIRGFPMGGSETGLSDESLARSLEDVLTQTDLGALFSYLDDGVTPPFGSDLVAPCLEDELVSLPRFELGFDFEGSRLEERVVGVDPDGPAHAAGVRDGMRLVRWSIHNGDATRPVKLSVTDRLGEKSFEYTPASREKLDVPRLVHTERCGD